MAQSFERERETAIQAVRLAAGLCQAVRAGLLGSGVVAKADRSPVTVADFGSQAVICRALALAFPNDPIIAEEGSDELRRPDSAELLAEAVRFVKEVLPGSEEPVDVESVCGWIDRGGSRSYADRFWTLDPIDGTKGFLRGEQYAVALALIERGKIVVAALACPNLPVQTAGFAEGAAPGSIFHAVRGEGAWAIPWGTGADQGAKPVRISVGSSDDPAAARFCESVESGHSAHGDSAKIAELLGIGTPPVRLDSQAKYAVVSRGEADIYLRMPTKKDYREAIWDHAAGALIVAEAGGIVSDIDGRPLDFTGGPRLEANRGVVVANAQWHPRVIAAIAELGLASV